MRAVFGVVLVVGMGLAGTAVYMVQQHFETQDARIARAAQLVAERVPTVKVWAVNRTIAYGEELTAADLVEIDHTEEFLPEGTFATLEDIFPEGERVTRRVIRQMEANEPVLASKVTDPGQSVSITDRLSPGMTAFTISVDATSGVGGLLRPGDHVSVFWTGVPIDSTMGAEITRQIEQSLRVVAVDQQFDGNMVSEGIARTITVEVTGQVAARLAQAQVSGRLSLALVADPTSDMGTVAEVDGCGLYGCAAPEAPPEPVVQVEAPQQCFITEQRGTERVQREIDCPS